MILDDLDRFRELDPQEMGAQIDGLPDQLEAAWDLGQQLPLPNLQGIRQVVVAGMGGSAIGADLLASYGAPLLPVPLVVWRDYDLPAYARGPETLVIASSHSGNTEETLSSFEAALAAEASLLAITTGGQLAERADEQRVPLWHFEHEGQPRAAVGYSFGLLLAALTRVGLLADPAAELRSATAAMRAQQESIRAEIPVVKNPAKRMAGQLMGRWPTIIGAGILAPVARRWRTQLSELAKATAQFEALPEADHNLLAGVEQPEGMMGGTMVVFLRGLSLHPRNLLRTKLTREMLMLEGFNTDIIAARGETRLAQQWTSLHFGDYVAYYLAMSYGVDPTPVPTLNELKGRLQSA